MDWSLRKLMNFPPEVLNSTTENNTDYSQVIMRGKSEWVQCHCPYVLAYVE